MNEQDLAAIEARANAATAGPWAFLEGGEGWGYVDKIRQGYDGEFLDADARLMAHARTDVPALVAEVRRLTPYEAQCRALLAAYDTGDTYHIGPALMAFRRFMQDDARAALVSEVKRQKDEAFHAEQALKMADMEIGRLRGLVEAAFTEGQESSRTDSDDMAWYWPQSDAFKALGDA